MSESLILYCRACHMAYRPSVCFPTMCPNPDCQINPARWTTFKPVAAPLTPFHNSEADRAFLKREGICQDD